MNYNKQIAMDNLSSHKDFYKVEGIKFDIVKLQKSLKEVFL